MPNCSGHVQVNVSPVMLGCKPPVPVNSASPHTASSGYLLHAGSAIRLLHCTTCVLLIYHGWKQDNQIEAWQEEHEVFGLMPWRGCCTKSLWRQRSWISLGSLHENKFWPPSATEASNITGPRAAGQQLLEKCWHLHAQQELQLTLSTRVSCKLLKQGWPAFES